MASYGSAGAIAASLPSIVVAGYALKAARAPQDWPLHAGFLFVAGALFALWALLSLGRNFALFPALREVVRHGPYRLLRHPAYLGEMAMVAACALAGNDLWGAWPVLAVLVFLPIRILAEERVLGQADGYQDYSGRTPWRLVPGLW